MPEMSSLKSRQSVLVVRETGFGMNSCGQVRLMWYWSSKICAVTLSVFAVVIFCCVALAQGDNPSHDSPKSDSQQKPISIFSIKGRAANFTGKRLAAALFQKLALDEILLVKNPLARTPAMNAWARQITAGETNKMLKAKSLLDALVARVNPPNRLSLLSRPRHSGTSAM